LKGSSIFIQKHLSQEAEEIQRKLNFIRKAAVNKQMSAKINGDKLIINSNTYTIDTLHRLPSFLQPHSLATRDLGKYLFFYGKECVFSNFYPSNFTVNNVPYSSCEQYYQHCKALNFSDMDCATEIMKTKSAGRCKTLGNNANDYNEEKWLETAYEVMKRGVYEKFKQNPYLCEMLLQTKDKILVEAAKNDIIWGIGMELTNSNLLSNSEEWGSNWMGLILCQVRDRLMKEKEEEC